MILNVQLPQKTIIINESQYKILLEDVYINGINNKKKQANLTYSKNNYSKGNLSPNDKLRTDKMNINNGDTYEVPLKGGIISYNITSIKGKEVMHYFKRNLGKSGGKTELAFKNEEGEKEFYELVMENSEFQQFLKDFEQKVGAVVNSKISDFKTEDGEQPTELSIYPVPSSSNFNITMGKILSVTGFEGMNVSLINSNILKKDTSKLMKDLDFIEKNKEYYNSPYGKTSDKNGTRELPYSHQDQMDTDLNKLIAHSNINKYIDELNSLGTKLIQTYNARNKQNITPRQIERIGDLYGKYVLTYEQLVNSATYKSTIENKYKNRMANKLIKAIKYSKGPSIEGRTIGIYNIARQSQSFNAYDIQTKAPLDVCQWETINFEIKKFGNDTRMALMNYYQKNNNADEAEMVEQEIEKARNTVVVVFDDNVSGGATLSDICLQLKKLGINNIIPITFGEMSQQWRVGMTDVYKPENGFNMNESVFRQNNNSFYFYDIKKNIFEYSYELEERIEKHLNNINSLNDSFEILEAIIQISNALKYFYYYYVRELRKKGQSCRDELSAISKPLHNIVISINRIERITGNMIHNMHFDVKRFKYEKKKSIEKIKNEITKIIQYSEEISG